MAIDYVERAFEDVREPEDLYKIRENATYLQMCEAERRVAFKRAIAVIEEETQSYRFIQKFVSIKFILSGLICGGMFYFLEQGYFLSFFQKLATYGTFGRVVFGIAIGCLLTNCTEVLIFQFLAPPKNKNSSLLVDLYKSVQFASDEKEGYYATLEEILVLIKSITGNEYLLQELVEVLDKEPFVTTKDEDDEGRKYLVYSV